jgi:cytochrome b561
MLESISYYPILGIPLVVYLGAITLISFIITALLAILTKKRIRRIPFKYHWTAAYLSLALGVLHGGLALLHYV